MDNPAYGQLVYHRGQTTGFATVSLDESGYCKQGRFKRPDGHPLTKTQTGEVLDHEGAEIIVTDLKCIPHNDARCQN